MEFNVIIPARYASTRLPGKPLREIAGLPMIQHVYARATASGAREVVIATDDQRIAGVARAFGARVCMTLAEHPSGTDRLAEAAAACGYRAADIIVNVQGDEPLIPPALIRQVALNLAAHDAASIATLCEKIASPAELFDPNVVKVVCDKQKHALYFSRAPIPWDRDAFAHQTHSLSVHAPHYRHIGIYAYRAGFLAEYVRWAPCPPEQMESLEQLRALWYGCQIHVDVAVEKTMPGVDTEADLKRVQAMLTGR